MYKILLFFTLFFVPFFASAEIYFSEIAWMGTNDSANEEWIEIYNSGEETSLSGWKIFEASGGTQVIALSGSIASGQYLSVCRTTPSVPSPLSGGCDINGSFGGSGLNNAGENLTLVGSSGSVVDEINASSGWPAGDSSTKETMQKSGSSWVTGLATPGSVNVTQSSDDEDDQDDDNNDEDDQDDSSTSKSSGKKETKPKYTKRVVDIKAVDDSVPAGSPVQFSLDSRDLNGGNILKGEFFWNMGDGTERYFRKNEKFEHTYDYEGTYIVTIKYYTTYFEGIEPDAVDKMTVNIGSKSVEISNIHLDGSIQIKNLTSQELDISNFIVKDNLGREFVIPDDTYIAGGKSTTLNSKRTGFSINSSAFSVFSPSGSFVYSKSRYENTSIKKSSVVANVSSVTNSNLKNKETEDINSLEEDFSILNLNEESVKNQSKQKQSPFWVIAFVLLILISSGFIFYIYKTSSTEEKAKEEDDFDLID